VRHSAKARQIRLCCPHCRLSNNLALVVDALGDSASSEVLKRDSSAVFPRYGVKDRTAAGSRVAYRVALIVNRECVSVWIAIGRRKNSGFAVSPYYRQLNPIISFGSRASQESTVPFSAKPAICPRFIDIAGLSVISA